METPLTGGGTASAPAPESRTGTDPWLNVPAAPPKKKMILWKWSLLATGLLFAFALWQCVSAFRVSAARSDTAVAHFHELLNKEDYQTLVAETDEGFGHDQQSVKGGPLNCSLRYIVSWGMRATQCGGCGGSTSTPMANLRLCSTARSLITRTSPRHSSGGLAVMT